MLKFLEQVYFTEHPFFQFLSSKYVLKYAKFKYLKSYEGKSKVSIILIVNYNTREMQDILRGTSEFKLNKGQIIVYTFFLKCVKCKNIECSWTVKIENIPYPFVM